MAHRHRADAEEGAGGSDFDGHGTGAVMRRGRPPGLPVRRILFTQAVELSARRGAGLEPRAGALPRIAARQTEGRLKARGGHLKGGLQPRLAAPRGARVG
jgi:hypothetical protein